MESIGPVVFVSSTFYDLKYIRESLKEFINSLGFRAVLFEKGDISYDPTQPLEFSCYDNINSPETDIYVLIIGHNYGSQSIFDRDSSITKMEFKSAQERHLPTYILIEEDVYNYHKVYRVNKDNETVKYPNVDVKVLEFIEEICALPLNNPIQSFKTFENIRFWLMKQWTGYFRTLIRRHLINEVNTSIDEVLNTTQRIEKYFETFLNRYAEENKFTDLSDIVIKEKEEKSKTDRNKKIEDFFKTKLGMFIMQHSELNSLQLSEQLFDSFKKADIKDFLQSLSVRESVIDDVANNQDSQEFYEVERLKYNNIDS